MQNKINDNDKSNELQRNSLILLFKIIPRSGQILSNIF